MRFRWLAVFVLACVGTLSASPPPYPASLRDPVPAVTAAMPLSAAAQTVISGGGYATGLTFPGLSVPLGTAPTSGQCLEYNGTSITGAACSGGGGGTPCTTTASSLQYDAAGAFGCVADWTANATTTVTVAAGGILDMHAATTLLYPVSAGCTSVTTGSICYDTTAKNTHLWTNGADSLAVAEASAVAANTLLKSSSSTISLLAASLATDDGTTFTYSGTGGITASAGPLTSGLPAGGVGSGLFLKQEGTVPSGLSASGQDNCYADSTQHGLLCNFNAGTTLPLVQGPASSTSTHLAAFNSTTGGLLADSGIVDTAAGLLAACTGCAPLASPTFSGTVTLPTGITDASSTFNVPTGVTLNIASGATLNCAAGSTCPSSGSTGSLTGSSLTAYNVYYFGGSGLAKAKSDSSSTLPGICVASSTTVCVYSGVVTNGSWSWTEGGLVYVSDATGGLMTQTAPSTSGHYIQIAGVATSSTTILVLPSVNVAGL